MNAAPVSLARAASLSVWRAASETASPFLASSLAREADSPSPAPMIRAFGMCILRCGAGPAGGNRADRTDRF